MADTAERWRNMTKAEIAAIDVGTLRNTIDDLCGQIERLRAFVKHLNIRTVHPSMDGPRGPGRMGYAPLTADHWEIVRECSKEADRD